MAYTGSHSSNTKTGKASGGLKKASVLLLVLALVACLAIGGTLAWMVSQSNQVVNTFEPGRVPISVVEPGWDGTVKPEVTIHNDGNVQALIRVAVVANAVNEEGKIVAGEAPSYTVNAAYWTQIGGYYYYNGVVEPGESTAELFTGPVAVTGGELNILAQSIQYLGGYNGESPEHYAWGREYDNGVWS